MLQEPPRILAITPGTRYLGIAAFRGPHLLDWEVKGVAGKTPAEKRIAVRRILLDLIEQYLPDALVLKRLHPSRSSERLNDFVRQIKVLARPRGVKVYQYSLRDLKDALCPGAGANKRRLAEALAAMYPAMTYDLQRETRSGRAYRIRAFEAVGLAVLCWEHIENE